jgi:hypothetical protein
VGPNKKFYDIKLAEYLEVLGACLLWLLLSTPPAAWPSLISGTLQMYV